VADDKDDSTTVTSSLADEGINSSGNNSNEMSISEELRAAIGSEYFDYAGDDDDDYCCCFFNLVMSILDPPSQDDGSPAVPSWQKTSRLLASKSQIHSAMNEDYTEILLDQAQFQQQQGRGVGDSSSTSNLRMHLAAASHLLQEFVRLQRRVRREASELGNSSSNSNSNSSNNTYFLPESLLETVYGEIMAFLKPRISDLYCPSALSEMTPRDAAAIVAWIQLWDDTLFQSYHHEGCGGPCPDSHGFATDRDMLMDLYVERAVVRELAVLRDQLQLRNLLAEEDDILRKSPDDGSMVSTVPEQITFMVDSQIRVARECLPEKCVSTVLEACNRQLSLLVGDWMLAVGSDWKNIPTHWFCTIVNDSTRLAELCEERNQSVLSSLDDNNASRIAADAIVREFQELASHSILFLCENIVSQLREPEPILSIVGARGWESDETQSAIERTIATLKDYYADLELWLAGSYWLPKVLKHCFDLTLQVYVESFFANTLAGGVQDPSRAAEELNEDYLRLVIFYNSDRFEPFHGTGGYYTQQAINSKLHIIRCLSKLVDPNIEPDDTSGEVQFLMRELIGDTSAVLHLAGLRKRHKGRESVEWLRVVSRAKRALMLTKASSPRAGPGSSSIPAQYKLPDLRNSKYLSNVRPNARDARRRMSIESLALAQSTGRLLKISLGGEKPKITTA
jgi:Exocyst complex component Sec6